MIKCVNFANQVFFILLLGNLLVNNTDLQALYLSGTFCHKNGTRPLAVLHLDNRLYIP